MIIRQPRINIHTYIHLHIVPSLYAMNCMFVHKTIARLQKFLWTYIHTNNHMYIHIYICIRTLKSSYDFIYLYIYMYVYAYAHTIFYKCTYVCMLASAGEFTCECVLRAFMPSILIYFIYSFWLYYCLCIN